MYFFDDETTDAQLKAVWRQHLRDPDLDFGVMEYRVLCKRLRLHRQETQKGTLTNVTENELKQLLDTALDDEDDACRGK